ncbi:6115_t:CDS:2 [Paraglomus occultum]|uniref:6115_t:CDS:1 n=1 Tax=Paraglomus occultum TaxID=144539 RepID=A0A9N9D1E0_9GLOM|nr:6115_t:CDS:2 [Paraglomus occultum]
MVNEALAKQKSEYDAEIEKLRKEVLQSNGALPLQSQKTQKTQAPVSQTVEPVRQPKGPPSNLKTEGDYEKYYLAKFFNNLGIYGNEDIDSNYPKKPFQRSRPQQKDNSIRLEEKVDEIGHMLSHLNINNQPKKPLAKSNRTQRYYPFQPINYLDEENSGYNEEDNIWGEPPLLYNKLFPESDDQLFQLLSPALREKITNPLTKNKWVESLEYMQCKIEDINIPEAFSDTASECVLMNKALNNALGWDLGIAPNFILTHNSDHVTKLIGGHKDVAISIKHKNGWLTVTVNIVVIDDKETDYLLCLGMPFIQKVKGIPDSDKHEFRMTVRGKSYIIPTFIKPNEDINEKQPSSKISSCCTTVIRDTAQDTESSKTLDSDSSSEELKKNA